MKTTIELPDELFRKAKVTAAMRGMKLKDLIREGLLLALQSEPAAEKPKKTLYDMMQNACGIVASGVPDLGSNSKHMKEFGRD